VIATVGVDPVGGRHRWTNGCDYRCLNGCAHETSVPQRAAYPFPVPDFADDTSSELERKVKPLMITAGVETISYLVLAYCWLVAHSDVGVAIAGFFHGLIWMAFVGMLVFIRADIGWTWGYTALVVATGPVGGVLVFARLKQTPRAALVPPRSPHAGR